MYFSSFQIKEGDKFPENVCKICIRQLENIICFVETCKSANTTLKNILSENELKAVKIYDSELSDGADDSESYYSNKNSESVVFKQETDINCFTTDVQFNEGNSISCPNCSEHFSSTKSLFDHYEEISNCRPKDYKSPRNNVESLLEIVDGGRIKAELLDLDQEYIRGKVIKGKRKFLCNYCGKNYTRKNGLDRHIMSHTGVKPFECKECGKRYITKDTLKTHILIHTGIKTHKCEVCQKSFIQSSHLNYHMRRHAGEKPHTCSFCGKGFLSTYHLERHKLMHTGVKPFKCHLCDKQFVRSTTLRDHLLLHTGERPFQCQHCGKQFNRKQTLTNHVNLVHVDEGTNVINNNYSANFFSDDSLPKLECT